MYRLVQFDRGSNFDRLPGSSDIAPLDPAEFAADGGDAHLTLVDGHCLAARCTLWWSTPPPHPIHRTGVVGHYAARDREAGATLLTLACAALRAEQCALALGPMDGNTWRRYRLVTDFGDEPPFFLEPANPGDWAAHFCAAGFSPFAHYRSLLNQELAREDPHAAAIARRLADAGVAIRSLDTSRIDDELRAIHAVAMAAFAGTPLYQPLGEEEFCAQFTRLVPFVRPELVLIAERDDRTVGFLFAIPDWLQERRGARVDTLIIKTVAVAPGRAHAGLGRALAWCSERRAAAAGFSRSIHALMAVPGASFNISRGYAQPMRRYVLFGRLLP